MTTTAAPALDRSIPGTLEHINALERAGGDPAQQMSALLGLLAEIARLSALAIDLRSRPATFAEYHHDGGTVGTSIKRLRNDTQRLAKGITLKADDDNSGSIYVGQSGLTSNNGFRLIAGQAVTIEIDDLSKVYVVGSAASQKYWYMAV